MILLRLVLAALPIHLALIAPNHPQAATWGALRLFPLELPVILGLLVVAGRWRALRAAIVGFLMVMLALKSADIAMFTAFARAFNPAVDLPLAVAGWHLGVGTLGLPAALLAVTGAVLALVLLALGLWWATGQWAALRLPRAGRLAALGATLVATGVAVAEVGWAMRAWGLPYRPAGAALTARVAVERALTVAETRAALAAFRIEAATDPAAALAAPLSALAGRDVLVVFVESYGRASFDSPFYRPAHLPILQAAGPDLAAAGLEVRSGWLTSPIEGGQSWLAHATLASGLTVPDLTRHAAFLASGRPTLFQIAAAQGWRTAAVTPATIFAWPEAARLGFQTVLDAAALDYRGLRFNWVTMPDQFTLARFRDRLPPDPRPLFAQIALISSHAPWVPVPDPVPWDAVGDGTIFDPMTRRGDPPQVVWADQDRVRAAYRDALAYSLGVTLDWVAREAAARGRAAPLVVLLGDHQAAGFVAQAGGRDVPVHLIAPPDVLAQVAPWGWTAGLVPAPDLPAWPMQDFRDRFLAAFSADPAAGAVPTGRGLAVPVLEPAGGPD